MPQNKLSETEAREAVVAVERAVASGFRAPGVVGTGPAAIAHAAAELGIPRSTMQGRIDAAIRTYGMQPDWSGTRVYHPAVETMELPSYQRSIDEIRIARRAEAERRLTAFKARHLIPIAVKTSLPIGILWFGDPHLDDPGTNFPLIERHVDIVNSTPGLFGGCVGDFVNNWRGKLAHLHAHQTTTQIEAIKLVEWFITSIKWLVLIGGNHDVWLGSEDPIMWFRRGNGGVYEWHGARLALRFTNGVECRVNVRHNFPGNSMYNPAHGGTKAAKFSGEDHIYVSGHTHDWAGMEQENPIKGIIWRALQLSAYKKVDDFGHQIGVDAKMHGEAVITVIDPVAHHPNEFVSHFWDIEKGAEYLTFLRERRNGK